jgi:hypothetical protein
MFSPAIVPFSRLDTLQFWTCWRVVIIGGLSLALSTIQSFWLVSSSPKVLACEW